MVTFRLGLLLPQYDSAVDAALEAARASDRLALDIWIAGQLFPISAEAEKNAFEPLTLMGAVAALTTRSRLGFMVLAAPYLPAIYLAKALITLDHIAAGRLDIGLGAGWREEEFRALGHAFGSGSSRRAQLTHVVDAISALAAGHSVQVHDGELFASGPPSVQSPRPPVWIAGSGRRLLELVGQRADWANFARGIGVEAFSAAARIAREASVTAGRNDGGPRLSLTATFLGGEDPDTLAGVITERAERRGLSEASYRAQLANANVLVGTPDQMAAQLRPYVDAGCEAAVLWPLDGNHRDAPATLALLRDRITPRS